MFDASPVVHNLEICQQPQADYPPIFTVVHKRGNGSPGDFVLYPFLINGSVTVAADFTAIIVYQDWRI